VGEGIHENGGHGKNVRKKIWDLAPRQYDDAWTSDQHVNETVVERGSGLPFVIWYWDSVPDTYGCEQWIGTMLSYIRDDHALTVHQCMGFNKLIQQHCDNFNWSWWGSEQLDETRLPATDPERQTTTSSKVHARIKATPLTNPQDKHCRRDDSLATSVMTQAWRLTKRQTPDDWKCQVEKYEYFPEKTLCHV
jgi:hypothetical protein